MTLESSSILRLDRRSVPSCKLGQQEIQGGDDQTRSKTMQATDAGCRSNAPLTLFLVSFFAFLSLEFRSNSMTRFS